MTAATATAMEKAMVGQPAPDFDMASTKNIEKLNENVKLADYKGRWVVLLFYPLDFTFVCPTELTAFSDRYEEFQGIGADIIGVSTDSVFSHRAWIKTPRDKGGVEGSEISAGRGCDQECRARLWRADRRPRYRTSRTLHYRS